MGVWLFRFQGDRVRGEQMRFKVKKRFFLQYWHNWYAWYPIRIDETFVWLEMVQRTWTTTQLGRAPQHRFPSISK